MMTLTWLLGTFSIPSTISVSPCGVRLYVASSLVCSSTFVHHGSSISPGDLRADSCTTESEYSGAHALIFEPLKPRHSRASRT